MPDQARAPIFDVRARSDSTPSEHAEDSFSFLNRIAGDFWDEPRGLVQSWANRLPSAEYDEVRARLRSRDDEQFRSAFLELFLHEALVRSGYRVVVHPHVEGTSRRPDFLVEREDERFFVEAIAPGVGREAKAAAARRNVLFDTVNRLDDPNFFLSLEELNEGPTPPAAARLRRALQGWLARENPDDVADIDRAPTFEWSHDGWRALFRAIPMRPDARGHRAGGRAIGVYAHGSAAFIDDAPTIRAALAAKHRAYGDLGAPYLVAIGTYIHDPDNWHAMNALYGRTAVQLGTGPDGSTQARQIRQPDGYFGVPPAWQNTQVTAVYIVNQLQPYSVPRVEATLWPHPRPAHALPPGLRLPGDRVGPRGDELVTQGNPRHTAELFGLPRSWPPGEAFPSA